jgi:hypothetical protein
MKIETELNAGQTAFFLIDNRVQVHGILEVSVRQTANGAGASPEKPEVNYRVDWANVDCPTGMWVPEERAGASKAALLAKL